MARTRHDITAKITKAKTAIDDVFHDTTVPPAKTRDALVDLREHIGLLLDTLPADRD